MNSPVTIDALRQPLAVHRGEVITVLARAGGIRIRTNARAHDEGSVGELVAVESLLNRKHLLRSRERLSRSRGLRPAAASRERAVRKRSREKRY